VGGIALVRPGDDLVLITDRGQTIRTRVDEVRETGRNAQGVRVMNVADGERVVAIETVGEREEEGLESLPPDSLTPPSSDPGESDGADRNGAGSNGAGSNGAVGDGDEPGEDAGDD